jgi:uncharacterized SAM-binding protein YcdF (DUF218 family)
MSEEVTLAGGAQPARHRLWPRLAGAASLLLSMVAALVISDFSRFISRLEPRERPDVVAADGIVALTGGAERISEAITLLANKRAKRLLITGVNQSTSAGALSAATPETADLLTCCIDLDRNALNTVGNALEAARWVHENDFRSIIVVTSSYHMPRSLMELRRVLPQTRLIAHPVVPAALKLDQWWRDPATFRLLVGEYVKYRGARFGLRPERPTAQSVQASLDPR